MVSRPSWVICSPVGRDQVASSQGTFPPGSHRIETDCPKKRSAVIRKRLVRKGGEKTLNYSCIAQSFNLHNDLSLSFFFFLVEKCSTICIFHPFKIFHSNYHLLSFMGFPGGSEDKASACNAGDPGSIPGLGRSPGEGNGNPLQYSCQENPVDRGAWWATVDGVAKSRTRLSDFTIFLSFFMHSVSSVA